jgi:steroid Delta-isomerase
MTESEVRQFLHKYFNTAMNEPVEAFLDLLTPDAVLEDPVGTPPHRGREAIGQFLAGGRALIERTDFEIHEIMACGSESAARWSARVRTRRGAEIAFAGIGVFSFDEEGKLRHIREFYDVANLAALFGQ